MARGERAARAVALGGALLALAVAAVARGRLHPDEVFLALEPAHRLAFGYGFTAGAWEAGLRNWALPGLLALPLWLGSQAGLAHPQLLVACVWAVCAGVQAAGTWALFRLVAERDGREAGLLAAGLLAGWGTWGVYAARPLGDVLCVPPLLGALLWAQRARREGQLRAGLLCGMLLGLAFVVRYPSAVFGVPLAVSLLVARRGRALAGLVVGAGAVLLLLGLLDLATWGGPWHSLRAFLHADVLAGGAAARVGGRAWWWDGPVLAGMVPLLLLWHFVRGLARGDVVVGAFGCGLGALLCLGQQEAHFLLPLLPLFVAIAAGPAWRTLATHVVSWRARTGLGALFLVSSLAAATVQLPAGLEREALEAFVAAGREEGLTGLLVVGLPWVRGGGLVYLHRDVPVLYAEEEGPLMDARFSHVLVADRVVGRKRLLAAGLCEAGRFGTHALWRRCGRGPPSLATP